MPEFQGEKTNFNIEQIERISHQLEKEKLEQIDTPQKKEVLRNIIGETIQKTTPVQPSQQTEETDEIKKKIDALKDLPEKEKIESLVKIALQDSIADAVKIAQKLGPFYIDALHDTLVDEFLNILIQQKKI